MQAPLLGSSQSLPSLSSTPNAASEAWVAPGSFEFVSPYLHHSSDLKPGTSSSGARSVSSHRHVRSDWASMTDPEWSFRPKSSASPMGSMMGSNTSWRSWHAGCSEPRSIRTSSGSRPGGLGSLRPLPRPEQIRWQRATTIIKTSQDKLPCLIRPSLNISTREKEKEHLPGAKIKTRGGREVHEISPVEKKVNQANALSRDRGAINAMIAANPEAPQDCKLRHKEVDERYFELMFAPIKNPRINMPVSCSDDPMALLNQPKFPKPASPHFVLPEGEQLVRVCHQYASLVRPHVPNGEDSGVMVMTRPAFCRMMQSLRLSKGGGKFVFHEAVQMFDALADTLLIKGCPLTSGSARGIPLAARRGNGPVPPHELPISDLFGSLLMNIADEVKGQRAISEQFTFVKKCFFADQLQTAENKATERAEKLLHSIAKGKSVMSLPETDAGKPRTPPVVATEKRKSVQQQRKSKRGSMQEEPEYVPPKPSDKELAEGLSTEERLYAHTFAVSKGEFLTSMLLEPELLQFTWMFDPIFAKLFEVYSDVPTSFLGHDSLEGHMSYCGFMRFCIDFSIFPTVVDFCTLQCIYRSAENVIDLQREDLLRVLQKDKATARFKVDDVVELAPGAQIERNAAGLKFGDPGRVIEVDVESEIHAVRIVMKNGKKKWYKADDLVPCSRSFNLEKDNYAFIKTRLEWLNKDFGEMTEDEMRCVTLLSAMEDWVTDRRLRVRDVFGMIDNDASGNLGPEEILKGVDFMGLENPPDADMCQKVLILIDADGSGEVDMAELDSVLMAIRERKARHRKADNFFLKQVSEMNGVELAAEEFFVPLVAKLDARSWGAVEFFAHFDADESGSLDVEEFLTAGETLGIVVNSIDMFKRCCILVDPNIDGSLGIGELNRVIAMVREALRARDQEAQDAKNPFLALAPTNPSGPKMVKIFGRKAFLECLLKIAFAYLSFHGSGLQAELPTHSKALWLLGYLNWQFKRHKAEHRMIAKMQSQTELGNLNKKAAATTASMKMKGGQQLANSTTMSMNTASLRDLRTGALTSGTSSEAKSTAPEEPKEPEVSRRMGAVDNAMWGKLQSMARQSIRKDGGGGQSRGFSTVLKGLHAQGLRERLAEREANDDFQNRKNARGSTSQENDDESEDEEEEDDGPEPEVRPGSSVRFSEAEVVKVEDLSSSDNGDMPVYMGPKTLWAHAKSPAHAPPAAGTRDLDFGALNTYGRMNIDWAAIHKKLPYERTPEAKAARKKLWNGCDNGNGYLSLAEVDKGIRDALQIDQIFHAKPAIMRAFQMAKNWGDNAKKGTHAYDYVQKKEFRILIQCLRHYFELWVMFEKIDTAGDRRIDLPEFRAALTQLAQWGVVVAQGNEQKVFNEIDRNHGGQVLFIEFCNWAISHKLDLGEEDDDGDMPVYMGPKSPADNEEQLEPSAEENPQEQGKMQPPAQAASTSKLQVSPTSKLQAPPSLSTSKLASPLSKLASVPEGQTSSGSSNSLSASKLQSPPSKLKSVPEAKTSPGDSEEATSSQALRTRKKAAEKEADAKRLAGAGRRGLLKLQSVVKQKKFAKYLPPLKRLIVQSPEIFVHAPNLPPGGAVTMETACSACGIPPSQGWGNSFCSQCGHADAILWQCIGKTEGPGPATLPLFDRIIIDFGVDNNGHGHGRHTIEAGH